MENEIFETKELATVFTREHGSIAQTFIERVVHILTPGGLKIKKYAADSNSYYETEVLEVHVNEKTVLSITMQVSK